MTKARLKSDISSNMPLHWTPAERRVLGKLSTPYRVQEFLDSLAYRNESVYCCPRQVLRERRAHCFDSALFAAAAFRLIGCEPLILDMRSIRHDDDHVIAIFKHGSCFGAVAKSNYAGLRWREPIYRSLRELVMSYFELYFNLAGQKTLREYSRPLNLKRFDRQHWAFSNEILPQIAETLDLLPHYSLLSKQQIRRLHRVDKRSFVSGTVGTDRRGCYPVWDCRKMPSSF